MSFIKEGTIVTCPHCKKELLRARTDVSMVGISKSSLFEKLDPDVELREGAAAVCPHCWESYAKMMIYTKDGWV